MVGSGRDPATSHLSSDFGSPSLATFLSNLTTKINYNASKIISNTSKINYNATKLVSNASKLNFGFKTKT
jgi:hypothetical protein